MTTEQLIDIIRREQAVTALESAKSPRSRDSYELGYISGFINGYERVIQILTEQQSTAEGRVRSTRPQARPVNPYLSDLDAAPLLPEQYRNDGSYRS